MGADNWTTCPRCLHAAKEAYQAQESAIALLYGQVSIEEFDRRREELVPVDPERFQTFREDYEIGVLVGGVLEWGYRGSCSKCNLSVEEKGSREFWSPGVSQ